MWCRRIAESGVVREFSIDPSCATTSRGSCGAPGRAHPRLRGTLAIASHRPHWLADIVRFVASPAWGIADTSDGSVMTLPLLGPMTIRLLSWFFLFLLVVAGLVALYILDAAGAPAANAAVRQHGVAG